MTCQDIPSESNSLAYYYLIMPDESIVEKDLLLLPSVANRLNKKFREAGSCKRFVKVLDIERLKSGGLLFTCTP